MPEYEQNAVFLKEDIYRLLREKGIAFESMEHSPVYTMEDMEQCHITDKGTVCKNLFLRDAKGKNHFLVTVPNAKQVNLKALAEQIGSTKLSFASGERLAKYLKVQQGCVSPFGILNDETKSVTFVADEDLRNDSEVGIHPNDNTASVWIAFRDLQTLIEAHGNEIMFAHF